MRKKVIVILSLFLFHAVCLFAQETATINSKNKNNQVVPLLLSNKGRYVWSDCSQNLQYDPLLDSKVNVPERTAMKDEGKFLWYPGQLSAHLQKKLKNVSQARCVNVGYPGKFYIPVNQAFFRKEVRLLTDTDVEWVSTGSVSLSLDGKAINGTGKVINGTGNSIRLHKGLHTLTFEVKATDNLPAIKISFNGQPTVEEWKCSLDGSEWNRAETSPVFGRDGKMPLDNPEVEAVIYPSSIVPVRNARIEDDKICIGKNGAVLIDFYHLEVGNVTFTARGAGKLTAYVGESPEEALNENEKSFEQFPVQPYTLTGDGTPIRLPERALRYVKLFSDQGCEISSVAFKASVWPVKFQMSFECDNEKMNRIWEASVATLHTSTHGFYLDGVKRDYLPWSMDAVLSTFGGDYVFGDEQVSRNSLSVAMLPLNPQKSDLGIIDYPLHALIGFDHYYKRYGDFDVILSYRDRMEQLLRFYETLQDERGFLSTTDGNSWGFIPGWANKRGPDKRGTPAYAQIMLYYNYKIGAGFSEKWGDRKAAKHYRQKAEALKDSIMKHFWDEEQGVFINGYGKNGKQDKTVSHHAQYWAILADIFPEERYDALFERLPRIAWYKDYVSYEKGYEFIAYSKAGRIREMWNFLFDVFGDWLEQGHTRFPENFSYKKNKNEQLVFYSRPYGLSLCHGANGVPGIVAVLNGIAGFSQSDTRLNHYTVRPEMLDLDWANIEFPVKEGKIKLNLSKDGKNMVEIPAGCQVDFIDKNGKKTSLHKAGIYSL
ncbi:trehalase family glycosidase [uncultured Bacteroides sp.]|uniref:alpha-L-rhamnosidase-related protein n=1 Tax=uncultured Bacteroides sp. TaxID=162156 RepID=UPI0025F108AE|nr:trehalase family glycosidase [uncultured Bacteroides sp.]